MKKILLALAVLASLQTVNAQVKSASAAQAAIDKALAETQNVKKATKAATWMKLAKTYMDAYNGPMGNAYVGANRSDLAILMGGLKPIATSQVVVSGEQLTKEEYPNMDMYFKGDMVEHIIVTKPFAENPLGNALKAYQKAFEAEPKKAKEIEAALRDVSGKYANDAYTKFSFGDYKGAKEDFEAAAAAIAGAPVNVLDTMSIYNAGFAAMAGGEFADARQILEKCIGFKYYGQEGDVYAKLAECASRLGDADAAKAYLEEGFSSFPTSQEIIIGLINYYLDRNEDPEKLFALIEEAQKNDPSNASLYYVEGNVHAQLGNTEKALAAYDSCIEKDPAYEYGYIGKGQLHYNNAVKLQDAASKELDDAKYRVLEKQFADELRGCIEPFEKAFEITKDENVKVGIAAYLKNAFYRFREESDTYKAGFEKYSKILEGGAANQ